MLIGNLGKDPEMRYTPQGHPVTTFSLAVNRTIPGGEGERKEETEWFNIITWNKTAEICNQYLTKGKRVFVEGRLHIRTWEGQDGQKRTNVEVIANTVFFLDKASTVSLPEEAVPDDTSPENLPF